MQSQGMNGGTEAVSMDEMRDAKRMKDRGGQERFPNTSIIVR